MNILLTGGAGYIGIHVAVALVQAGHSIVIYDNFCNSKIEVIQNLEKVINQKAPFIKGDVRDIHLLQSTMQHYSVDAVIHLAGLKSVGESVANPLEYYENNIGGILSLLRAMNEQGVKNLVFSSSATVYGDPQYLPIDENHPVAPTNPYGRTKLQIEQMLKDLTTAEPSFKVINLRYFNPVGAHTSALLGENPNGIPNNLLPFISRVATGELSQLKVFGKDYPTVDGTGVRDYVHVMDLAEGHLAALAYFSKSKGFEVFNLGTGQGLSVLQIIEAYEKVSKQKIHFVWSARRPGDIASCYASPEKANKILGWKACRTLVDMCASSWQFQQENRAHT
jgi:UDP-glucose 4-epimerase